MWADTFARSEDLEAEEQLIRCLVQRLAVKECSVVISSIVEQSTLDLNVTNLSLFVLCYEHCDLYVYR